jgi:hypothetical protein
MKVEKDPDYLRPMQMIDAMTKRVPEGPKPGYKVHK